MPTRRASMKLMQFFQQQSVFSTKYSPLYQRLFREVAEWLERDPNGKTAKWLLDVSYGRSELETSLLLMAAVHRDVLLMAPGTEELSEYFPTVVGGENVHPVSDKNLGKIFQATVDTRRDSLGDMIQSATVQTNETARGIFWLFPTVLTGWKDIHVVDLGASAGLNLVADQRCFTFVHSSVDSDNQQATIDKSSLGLGSTEQFEILCEPDVPHFWAEVGGARIPTIHSRNGCDLNPFRLETEEDIATLKSFVWPDQLNRVTRLEEGIAAHSNICKQQPVTVGKANLPHDLPLFLRHLELSNNIPTVLYNTYMTKYLENDGHALQSYIDSWANETNRTVLWIQAEPPRFGMPDHPNSSLHTCAWTVDLFQPQRSARHLRWHIAWVHPHATTVEWLGGLNDFVRFFAAE